MKIPGSKKYDIKSSIQTGNRNKSKCHASDHDVPLMMMKDVRDLPGDLFENPQKYPQWVAMIKQHVGLSLLYSSAVGFFPEEYKNLYAEVFNQMFDHTVAVVSEGFKSAVIKLEIQELFQFFLRMPTEPLMELEQYRLWVLSGQMIDLQFLEEKYNRVCTLFTAEFKRDELNYKTFVILIQLMCREISRKIQAAGGPLLCVGPIETMMQENKESVDVDSVSLDSAGSEEELDSLEEQPGNGKNMCFTLKDIV